MTATLVLAVAAFAGGAYAATQSSPTTARQAFLNDVAKRLNVTPAQLKSALQNAYFDQLSAAVKAGRLSQARANAIKQRVQRTGVLPFGPLAFGRLSGRMHPFAGPLVPNAKRHGVPAPPGPPGQLGRPGTPPFPPRPGGFRPVLGGAIGAGLSYLGLKPTQVLSQLRSGKSLAQIATARGKTVAGLKTAVIGAQRARLDRLVKAKLLSSAQEQKLLARTSAAFDRIVDRKGLPLMLERFRFGPRHP